MAEETRQRVGWRDIFVVELIGLRAVMATVLPLVVGQITGNPTVGLLVGMGGLQAVFLDAPSATTRLLVWGAFASAAIAFLGGLASTAPAVVAIALMFAVAFGMGLLSLYGNFAGNMGFVLTLSYAFAQNTPVPLRTSWQYFVAFLVGGAWAVLLTLGLWQVQRRIGERQAADKAGTEATSSVPLPESMSPPGAERAAASVSWYALLRANLSVRSSVFQHAARAAIAVAVAVAICRLYHPPHGFWLVLSCLVILKPDYAATQKRTLERVLGTIVGGLLAVLPAAFIHNLWVLDLLLVVCGVIAFSHLPRNYGLYVVFLTPFVVLLSTLAAPGDAQAALARIYETLLGGLLAWSVAFLLRSPRHYLPMLYPTHTKT